VYNLTLDHLIILSFQWDFFLILLSLSDQDVQEERYPTDVWQTQHFPPSSHPHDKGDYQTSIDEENSSNSTYWHQFNYGQHEELGHYDRWPGYDFHGEAQQWTSTTQESWTEDAGEGGRLPPFPTVAAALSSCEGGDVSQFAHFPFDATQAVDFSNPGDIFHLENDIPREDDRNFHDHGYSHQRYHQQQCMVPNY